MNDQPLTGVLFMRDPKSPKHPDFKGNVVLASGERLELAGWFARDKNSGNRRTDKNGKPWINLKLSTKQQERQPPPPSTDSDPFGPEPTIDF